MENLMNTKTTGALYVQHFNMALINFEKQVKEERLSRIARIAQLAPHLLRGKIKKRGQNSAAFN